MSGLKFDDSVAFDQNWEAFLAALESIDPEMTKILRDNSDSLKSIVRSGARNAQARSEFNARVLVALEALAAAPDSEAP